MLKKYLYIITLAIVVLPNIGYAQAKPKRDTAKDKSVHVSKKQQHTNVKKSNNKNHFTQAKSKTQNNKKGKTVQTTLSVSNNFLNFSHEEETKSITVYCNSKWHILIEPNNWGHYTINENVIRFKVDRNPFTTKRTDYFTIAAGNKTVRIDITQEKRPPTLTISEEYLYVSASGGTRTININSDGEPWNISLNPASWGHLTKQGNTIQIRFDSNTNTSKRTDFFVIKSGNNSKRVFITQDGAPYSSSSYNRTSNYNNGANYRSYSNYSYHESWWKNRISFGIEIFGDINYNYFKKSQNADLKYNYGTGLVLRIGKFSDFINFSTGVKWMGLGFSNSYSSKGNISNYFVFPGTIKFNLFYIGSKCKLYLGGGFEYGLGLKQSYNFMDWNTGIGINSRHVDWNLYYKNFIKCNDVEIFPGDYKHHIGTSFIYYF